jgi:hypothetical protein
VVRLVHLLPGNDGGVNAILAGLAAVGGAAERVALATGAAPRAVKGACMVRAHRRVAVIVAAGMLILYLFAIGDIAVSVSGRLSTTPALQTEVDNLFRTRAPYLFEPVLALRPDSHLTVYVSPLNILLGSVVAVLAAANVAVARDAARQAVCRRTGFGRLVGVLPVLGLGFACCTPALLIALGSSAAAALGPTVLAVRPVFYPFTVLLLTATLLWGARAAATASRKPGVGQHPERTV